MSQRQLNRLDFLAHVGWPGPRPDSTGDATVVREGDTALVILRYRERGSNRPLGHGRLRLRADQNTWELVVDDCLMVFTDSEAASRCEEGARQTLAWYVRSDPEFTGLRWGSEGAPGGLLL